MSDVKVTVTRDAYPGEVILHQKIKEVVHRVATNPVNGVVETATEELFQYIANNEHQKAAWPDDEGNPF